MRFSDRRDAAERLTRELQSFKARDPVIWGVPPGGVAVASILADGLGLDMEPALVHRLLSPTNPSVVVGAVDEEGNVRLQPYYGLVGVSLDEVRREAWYQQQALRRLRDLTGGPPIDVRGRPVVIVDDGATSGSTLLAAIKLARLRAAAAVVVALPAAPRRVVQTLDELADATVVLYQPEELSRVADAYDRYAWLDDGAVLGHLRRARARIEERARLDALRDQVW